MIQIEVAQGRSASVNENDVQSAAKRVFAEAQITHADVSVAVVDDRQIHVLNRRHLGHDYPTDVLSFILDQQDGALEGEVIVSADTAARQAAQYHWDVQDELMLYIVHGLLHLAGYDDQTPEDQREMREAERRHLAPFGLSPRYD